MSQSLDRRTFLTTVASACAACATCPLAVIADDAKKAPEPKAGEVGKPSDFPKDGIYDKYAETHGFFVIRRKGRLYAVAASCTHRNSLLIPKEGALACPKHGARFDAAGEVIKAPAKKPLLRYGISADVSGTIKVDPGKTFDKDHRDEKGSFLTVS